MSNGKGMTPKKGYNQKNWDSNFDLIDWGRKDNRDKCSKCGNDDWLRIPCSLAEACRNCGSVRVLDDEGDYVYGSSIKEWMDHISKEKEKYWLKEILEDAKKAKSELPDWAKEGSISLLGIIND